MKDWAKKNIAVVIIAIFIGGIAERYFFEPAANASIQEINDKIRMLEDTEKDRIKLERDIYERLGEIEGRLGSLERYFSGLDIGSGAG
jgi:hypothetical protein